MAEACVANIGAGERGKRLRFGWIMVGVAAAALVGLLMLDASRWWRLPLALPIWSAALGYLQHREKT